MATFLIQKDSTGRQLRCFHLSANTFRTDLEAKHSHFPKFQLSDCLREKERRISLLF